MYLPLLVLKARHLGGSAFYTGLSRLEVPEQALGGIPLGLGLVVKINLLNIYVHVLEYTHIGLGLIVEGISKPAML